MEKLDGSGTYELNEGIQLGSIKKALPRNKRRLRNYLKTSYLSFRTQRSAVRNLWCKPNPSNEISRLRLEMTVLR